MNDSVTMRLIEREANLIEKLGDNGQRGPGMRLLECGERLAVEQFHDEIGNLAAADGGNSEVRDVDDVGVAQTAAGLGFPLKAAEELGLGGPPGRDDLDGNDTGGPEVGGEVDVAHAAGAKLTVNAIFGIQNLANHLLFRISRAAVGLDISGFRTSAQREALCSRHRLPDAGAEPIPH